VQTEILAKLPTTSLLLSTRTRIVRQVRVGIVVKKARHGARWLFGCGGCRAVCTEDDKDLESSQLADIDKIWIWSSSFSVLKVNREWYGPNHPRREDLLLLVVAALGDGGNSCMLLLLLLLLLLLGRC
jgi:hypothetical protein